MLKDRVMDRTEDLAPEDFQGTIICGSANGGTDEMRPRPPASNSIHKPDNGMQINQKITTVSLSP